MKSMTGFGRATTTLGASALAVQVNSVNRKTLDLTVALPDEWELLESAVLERVRKAALRGKVHVLFELTGESSTTQNFDELAVEAALDRLGALAARRGVAFELTPELLWQVASSQRRGSSVPELESVRIQVLDTLEIALKDFSAMRAREGSALLADFQARLEVIRTGVEAIATRAPEVPVNYREQLSKRLRDAGLDLNPEDDRVLKEIALFVDRCDVAEELTRLRSHLEQFTAHLRGDGELGRKSEFILQEIGREIHTIGSKANDLIIARQVIELKNEVERIKEQVANVE